ncbi:ATP-binding cassette domain-containing protein [Mycobacterium sp. MBM]|nr:ATP-binding cassette domain-containing protein [Mycobacterium sp. MBM]
MNGVRVSARLHRRGTDLDVTVADGGVLAVLGPNGAGKSTLLSLIAGLLKPDAGRIAVGATVLTDTDAGTFVPPHARGVAMLSQQAMLFPHMSVAANVGYAPRCRGLSRGAAREAARHWMDTVGVTDLAGRKPAQLSGGQAQRVALARALAAEPRLLLLDEPMASLDVTAAPAMRRLLREVLTDTGRTAIIVTHDLLDALAIADTMIVLDRGRVVESGTVREVLTTPRSEFAAAIAGVNLVPGTITAPGILRTPWGAAISGVSELPAGASAIALFRPAAVAVHLSAPHGSPRTVIEVRITELDIHGAAVRVRGVDPHDERTVLAADITAAAAAELDLVPGGHVFFVVKTQEVQIHPALAPMM